MHFNRSTRRLLRSGAVAALAAALAATVVATPGYAEDKGFYYGADSGAPSASGTNGSGVYQYPSVCGTGHAYGGYIGKIGGADLISSSNPHGYGPGHSAWNATAAAQADANYAKGVGVGTGGYWFMYGLNTSLRGGLSPYNWGKQQAQWAIDDWQQWWNNGQHKMPFKILWMDIDSTTQYGWTTATPADNRLEFNGFWDTIDASSENFQPGVYATADTWNALMSGHNQIPNTWEWTAQTSRGNHSASPCPTSDSASDGLRAVFFGGQSASSAHAAVWQWAYTTSEDFDQINTNKNLPLA